MANAGPGVTVAGPAGAPYTLPLPREAVRVPRGHHLLGCIREAAGDLTRWAGREPTFLGRSRTPEASLAEYGQRWAAVARSQQWRAAETIPEAIRMSSYGTGRLHAVLDFAPYWVPAPAFFQWRARKLGVIFRSHHELAVPMTEIGCGTGKNLLALAAAGFSRLAGYDPVGVAVRCVAGQAAHFGLDIRTGCFDLLRPAPAVMTALRGQVLFTNHVLEQLPRHIPNAVDTLLCADPLEVIQIEPCPELLRPLRSAVDLATWLHTYTNDYQRTLLGELARRQRLGELTVVELTPLGYAPRPRSTPVLIRWRPGDL